MPYNHDRYNLTRYNVKQDSEEDYYTSDHMTMSFHSWVSRGGNLFENDTMHMSFESQVQLSAAILPIDNMVMTMNASADGYAIFYAHDAMASVFNARASIGKDIYNAEELEMIFNQHAYMSLDVYASDELSEVFNGNFQIGKDVYMEPLEGFLVYNAQVTTQQMIINQIIIDAEIKPGDIIVINSEGYVVTRNGEDIIHTQSGAWFFLNRNTHDIQIEVTGGVVDDLSKEILYTTRYK